MTGVVQSSSGKTEKAVSGAAALAGVAAVTAWASCCVLPMALAAAGLAGLGGGVMIFAAGLRTPITLIGLAVLATGWALWLRSRRRCAAGLCSEPPSRAALTMLIVGSTLFALAFAWAPIIEPLA